MVKGKNVRVMAGFKTKVTVTNATITKGKTGTHAHVSRPIKGSRRARER